MSPKEASSRSISLKRQETPLLVPKEIAPQIKTSVGITYAVLSEAILATVKSAKPGRLDHGQLDQETILKFKDALFTSPRLTQWENEEYPNGYAQWRIYASDDITFVIVDKKDISIHKGERSSYEISDDPLIAGALFSAIEQAQRIVGPPVVDVPMTDEEQDEYFDGGTQFTAGAGLDEALADTHVEPLSDGDAELIHDVTTEEALDEDQVQEDGPEPIVTVSQAFIDAVAQTHTDKNTSRVDAEVARVKEEYPELKDKKTVKPKSWKSIHDDHVSNDWVLSRYKSLQGRILNIVEASISDKEQRAAIKTLVNKEFRREINNVTNSRLEE